MENSMMILAVIVVCCCVFMLFVSVTGYWYWTNNNNSEYTYIVTELKKYDVTSGPPNIDRKLYDKYIPEMAKAVQKTAGTPEYKKMSEGDTRAASILAIMNLFASFDPQFIYQNRNMSSNSKPSDIKPPWQDSVPFDAWLIQKK